MEAPGVGTDTRAQRHGVAEPLLQKPPACMYFVGSLRNSAWFASRAKRQVTHRCSAWMAGLSGQDLVLAEMGHRVLTRQHHPVCRRIVCGAKRRPLVGRACCGGHIGATHQQHRRAGDEKAQGIASPGLPVRCCRPLGVARSAAGDQTSRARRRPLNCQRASVGKKLR